MEHRVLKQEGNDIHYYIRGNKENETIVFLHSAFSDHSCFYKQVDFFSKTYFVITVDLLGHGKSKVFNSKTKIDQTVTHICSILKEESIDRAHFVGVSMGALLAQYMALENEEMVLSLTLLGGYNINSDNKEILDAQGKEKLKWLFKIIFSMDSFRNYVSSVSVINEEEREHFFMSTKGFTRKSFMIMSGLQKVVKKREFIKYACPVLLLCGEQDNPLALNTAELWHKEDPSVSFHLIANSGHCANIDNPDDFNKIVLDFLLGVSRE